MKNKHQLTIKEAYSPTADFSTQKMQTVWISYPERGFVIIDICSSWPRFCCSSDLGKNDTLLKEEDLAMVLGKAINDGQVSNTQHPAKLRNAALQNTINQPQHIVNQPWVLKLILNIDIHNKTIISHIQWTTTGPLRSKQLCIRALWSTEAVHLHKKILADGKCELAG